MCRYSYRMSQYHIVNEEIEKERAIFFCKMVSLKCIFTNTRILAAFLLHFSEYAEGMGEAILVHVLAKGLLIHCIHGTL